MKRLLIANRGEIAVRVIRAARELGVETVAVYSDADQGALHVRLADRRIALDGAAAKDTYLHQEKLLNAALQSSADAVHPGYGFFAENAEFARAVGERGLIFVGPKPESIALMAAKDQARRRVSEFNVPVIPGADIKEGKLEQVRAFAKQHGYPVMLKAVHGGSGRGMRIVENEEELEERLREAQREAKSAFGSEAVLVEKYLIRPRHIEVQVFGDAEGSIIHFGERECSLQRRHQKLVEESPAPNLHPAVRNQILEAAINAARSVDYLGAGTVEFLVEDGSEEGAKFYFLEMNTRIQVEHPVTELVTGYDLLKLQLEVAGGKALGFTQQDVLFAGHAIEFRVNAEDPRKGFQPTFGEIKYVSRPFGPGVREDSWIEAGTTVSSYYDSLLSKLIVFGVDRRQALLRARSVLSEYVIEGPQTTLGFHRWLLENKDFQEGVVDTNWVERLYNGQVLPPGTVGPFILPQNLEARES